MSLAMEKCMQLAPAFNLLNMLPTSDYTRGTPFDNIQFSNLENLVSLWRTKRDTGLVNVDEDDAAAENQENQDPESQAAAANADKPARKPIKLTFEEYKQISHMFVFYMRKAEEEATEDSMGTRRSELVNWYLKEMESEIETEAE